MLKNRKWVQAAPEVPEEFHAKFEQTLSMLEGTKPVRKKSGKKRILLIAAALCAVLTATAAAAAAFKWSSLFLERYQGEEEKIAEMENSGLVKPQGQSVTQNGVTVTLTETLQDSRSIYLLFEVETPEDIVLDDTAAFENGLTLTADGVNVFDAIGDGIGGSGGGGFVSERDMKQQSPHKRAYEMTYLFDGEVDFSGKTMETSLKNLMLGADKALDGQVVAEGTWSFSWQADSVVTEKRVEVNQRYDFGGYEICIRYLDISPLGIMVYADYEDAMEVEKDERNTMEYEGDDPGMEVMDRLWLDSVEYQDGTRVKDFDGGGGSGRKEENGETFYTVYQSFHRVLNVEKMKSIYLMNGSVEIRVDQ